MEDKTWFEGHWQMITAICTLAIAIMGATVGFLSFWYTVDQQRVDNVYKELAVRPKLLIIHRFTEYQTTIANYGLGPAEIKRVALRFQDFCIDSAEMDPIQWAAAASVTERKYVNFIFEPLLENLRRRNPTSYGDGVLLSPGHVLQAGAGAKLVGWHVLNDSESKLGTNEDSEVATSIYATQISALQIQLEYCSLTGRFCSKLDPNRDVKCSAP